MSKLGFKLHDNESIAKKIQHFVPSVLARQAAIQREHGHPSTPPMAGAWPATERRRADSGRVTKTDDGVQTAAPTWKSVNRIPDAAIESRWGVIERPVAVSHDVSCIHQHQL